VQLKISPRLPSLSPSLLFPFVPLIFSPEKKCPQVSSSPDVGRATAQACLGGGCPSARQQRPSSSVPPPRAARAGRQRPHRVLCRRGGRPLAQAPASPPQRRARALPVAVGAGAPRCYLLLPICVWYNAQRNPSCFCLFLAPAASDPLYLHFPLCAGDWARARSGHRRPSSSNTKTLAGNNIWGFPLAICYMGIFFISDYIKGYASFL
jgi:hypothetical protein